MMPSASCTWRRSAATFSESGGIAPARKSEIVFHQVQQSRARAGFGLSPQRRVERHAI